MSYLMRRRSFLGYVVCRSSLGVVAVTLGGCGTLLHPERHGAAHSNQIDWKIVAMDGLGLILFFVPGVIAFVVDFSTGAIYLPAGPRQAALEPIENELVRVQLPPQQLQLEAIETTVGTYSGRPIVLRDDATRVSELATIEAFDRQRQQHDRDRNFGHALRNFFTADVLRS